MTNNQSREIQAYYEYIPGDVLQFVVASHGRVVVFGRFNQNSPILQLAGPGMDIYKQTYRRCAPEFDAITTRSEKTAYLSDLVTYFINEGILFIQKDGDNYFRYNMEIDEAFKKVRGKIRQAMRDFLREEFQENEGPVLPGRDLMDAFDAPFEPEIEQVLANMEVSSEDGGDYDLDEVQNDDIDNLSFSDFPMMD